MESPPLPSSAPSGKYRALVVLAGLAGLLLLGGAVGLRAYVIGAGSMEDTLQIGDRVLVEKIGIHLGWLPKRGDLVAMEYPIDPKQKYFKRVVGIPGDRLRIVNKQLYRNGVAVEEPYARHKTNRYNPYRDNFPGGPWNELVKAPAVRMFEENVQGGEVVVPPGQYFVLGDNRDFSFDSRYFGFISRGDIVGRPLLIYFSPKADRIFKPL